MKKNQDKNIDFEEFAPELSKMKKENPFKVPDGYFDNLPSVIQEKIKLKSESSSIFEPVLAMFKQPKYYMMAVLSVVIITIALFVLIKPADQDTQFFTDLTIEDIIEEYPELIYDLDESTIIEILYAANGQDTYDFFENDIYTDTTITEDEIIDYLNDENIETELIYNL